MQIFNCEFIYNTPERSVVVFDQTFSSNSQLHKVLLLAYIYVQVLSILVLSVQYLSVSRYWLRPLSFCGDSTVLVSRVGLAKDCVNILTDLILMIDVYFIRDFLSISWRLRHLW